MSRPVSLHVYDLSNGLARQLSRQLLGRQIDGIWHTGVVIGGREYFFGQGIQHAPAGRTPFGDPWQVVQLGASEVPDVMVQDFLAEIHERFNATTYNLLSNNCNNFSEELAQFLVGQSIPAHITGLPAEVASTPFGQMIIPMLQPAMEQRFGNATATSFAPPPRPTAQPTPAPSTASPQPAATPAPAAAPSDQAATAVRAMTKDGDVVKAQKAFQAALEEEFRRVQDEGLSDANAAGAEAMKRVMLSVRQGLVAPPVQAAAGSVRS